MVALLEEETSILQPFWMGLPLQIREKLFGMDMYSWDGIQPLKEDQNTASTRQ